MLPLDLDYQMGEYRHREGDATRGGSAATKRSELFARVGKPNNDPGRPKPSTRARSSAHNSTRSEDGEMERLEQAPSPLVFTGNAVDPGSQRRVGWNGACGRRTVGVVGEGLGLLLAVGKRNGGRQPDSTGCQTQGSARSESST
ncbi:hypothetical protein BO71DRAFT_187067 [Aspergillus ellipticus CBS 707.79]|uniref:Uncharacterized protein n=1 Tax=Aspergillus ellipticus CBS 707.79 TaxID=1448320 RepID=A0A319CSW1_9EURO|nr:hypothetical protein BO71DRAFT_187067 [Aspergillus ellipticus CBS 707.79]